MMGHYTSIVISARLKLDTPVDVIQTVMALLSDEVHIRDVLGGDAHRNPLRGTSSYFPEASSKFLSTKYPNGYTLNVVSHIKNYDKEIEGFIAWLRPYVESGHGKCEWWAIVTDEDDVKPTLYYLREPDD